MTKYNVSRETYDKLTTYVRMLKEWQQKFNLVSNNSLSEVWERHVSDSAQLFKYLPDDIDSVYDLGSGAGFPGLVLAIMAQEQRPDLKFRLIESITKKTVYLNAVKTELKLENVSIVNERAEKLKFPAAGVITARAMTALENLLTYAERLANRQTLMIFPKGRSYKEELTVVQKKWNFKLSVKKNEVSSDGVILLLENVRRKSK